MKNIFALAIACSFACSAGAAGILNCHTDRLRVDNGKFESYDMTFYVNDQQRFENGGTIYVNTYLSESDRDAFSSSRGEGIHIKDSLLSLQGRAILFFTAGDVNYVLDVEREGVDRFAGELRKHAEKRFSVAARCYHYNR